MPDDAADSEPTPSAAHRVDPISTLAVPTDHTSRRLVSVQCLRGIAALMVLVHHVIHQTPGFLAVCPTEAWQAGVDLFFVISGFVMVYVTTKRERSAKKFLAMRAARIVPVYWFYTLLAAGLMLVMPRLFRSNELSVKHVLLSLFFVPHETAAAGWSPLVKQGWTLNYEVFFYVLFAIAMAISIRHRSMVAIAALILIAATGHLLRHNGTSVGVLGYYADDIILEFGFGILIAVLFLRGSTALIHPPLAAALVIGGFITMFALQSDQLQIRAYTYGLPAAMIVLGALAFEQHVTLRSRFLQYAGDSSYSIYLVHIFPIAILRAVWPLPMQGAISLLLFLLVSIVLVVGIASISYSMIEQRSLRFLRPRIDRHLT